MASLVLGGIGGIFFGPIGFMVGSLLGNLLFPQKQEGPRLSDLKLQGSQYGQMIPIVYGTVRLAGQVVWQTDLKEQKHTTGGKGGPQVTTYTYSASFAVKICKGPILGVLRIWANSTLIYDTSNTATTDNSRVPVTIYLGVETAGADPTMEAELGVGNVPAFRDDCVCVFTDWDLGDYGNTLPQLSFEVFTNVVGQIPTRINTWDVAAAGPSPWDRFIGPVGITYVAGNIRVAKYDNNNETTPLTYNEDEYTFAGAFVTNIANFTVVDPNGGVATVWRQAQNTNAAVLFSNSGVWFEQSWYAAGLITAEDIRDPNGNAINGQVVLTAPYYFGGYMYTCGGSSGAPFVARWPAPDGVPGGIIDAYYYFDAPGAFNGNSYTVTVDETGNVWCMGPAGTGFNGPVWRFAPDLTLLHYWVDGTGPQYQDAGFTTSAAYGGYLAFRQNVSGTPKIIVYRVESDFSFTQIGMIDGGGAGGLVRFNGCDIIALDGVIGLCLTPGGVTLASIVSDLSVRAGLTTGQIDVTQLPDIVDGYLITTQTDVRSDIDPLRQAWFFDGVESAGVVKFVKRGGAVVVSIPDADLAVQEPTGTPPPLAEVTRAKEEALPATVNVSYVNKGASYQTGTQQARRQVGGSQAIASVQLAIVMDDLKAKQVASVLCFGAWMERDLIKFSTSRQYDYLEPTDVVTAHGYTMRIIRKTEKLAGVVELEALETNAAIYLAAPTGTATSGGGQTTPGTSQSTAMLLLDIPMVQDTDVQTGFRAAMAGSIDNTWRGAALYRSADNGATYDQIATDRTADVMGKATTTLGDFGSGNIFDESNEVTVVIGNGGGTLASASADAVLSGANEWLLGSEIVQGKNAVLTAPQTYRLSGLLRGRRGTEWAQPYHVAGERFVALPTSLDLEVPFPELGVQRLYKGVSLGQAVAGAQATPFVDNGLKLQPYSLVSVGGGSDASGNVTIQWIRRTRVGGIWKDFVDVPLSEATEGYVVQIWNAGYTQIARIITGLTTPTATYTAAQQTNDFGSVQQTVFFTVGQTGAFRLGQQTSGSVPCTGAGNNDPLVPLPPYQSPPPQGGSVCAGTVQANNWDWNGGSSPRITFPGFAPGITWLIDFTTGAINAQGRMVLYEFGGPPMPRNGALSASPCGPPVAPFAAFAGEVAPSIPFYVGAGNPYPAYVPTLAYNTKYYFYCTTSGVSAAAFELNH